MFVCQSIETLACDKPFSYLNTRKYVATRGEYLFVARITSFPAVHPLDRRRCFASCICVFLRIEIKNSYEVHTVTKTFVRVAFTIYLDPSIIYVYHRFIDGTEFFIIILYTVLSLFVQCRIELVSLSLNKL